MIAAVSNSPISRSDETSSLGTELFPQLFTHERLVRRRMQALSTAGLVATHRYATIGRGAVNYYKLTPLGFQVLNGPHAVLPNRGFFQAVSMAIQARRASE